MYKSTNQRNNNGWKKRTNHKPVKKERLSKLVRQNQILKYGDAEKKRLFQLQKDLLDLGPLPKDAVELIRFNVKFLNIISFFQDDGIIEYQPDDKESAVSLLNEILEKCGRQPDKTRWNQSEFGQPVTLDNVIYGSVFGLPIKPARYWISCSRRKTIIIDYHNPLLVKKSVNHLDVLNNSKLLEQMKKNLPADDVIYSKEIWITDAIVFHGDYSIERFTRNNLLLTLEALEELLA